jgi:hypothetical protein
MIRSGPLSTKRKRDQPAGIMSEQFEDDPEPSRPALWRRSINWSFVLFAGWLIYELTTLPALAVVTVCLKFGWNDFKTAFWLWRRDSVRARARACSLMYLAWGLWKTALIAIVPMFLIPVVMMPPGGKLRRGLPPMAFIAAVLVVETGFLFSAVTTLLGVSIALKSRTKVWLDSAIHRDQADNVWPPIHVLYSVKNKLSRPLTAALFCVCLPLLIGCVIWVGTMLPNQQQAGGGQPLWDGTMVFLAVLIIALIGFPVVVLKLSERLQRRIGAQTAAECWPDAYYSELDEEQSWESESFETTP